MLVSCLSSQDLHDCDPCVMQVQLQVLDPVPKEQRDLAYWETRYQKADELFAAASAMEATADHETALLLQAAGPSAAEGQ